MNLMLIEESKDFKTFISFMNMEWFRIVSDERSYDILYRKIEFVSSRGEVSFETDRNAASIFIHSPNYTGNARNAPGVSLVYDDLDTFCQNLKFFKNLFN